jgi:hypothetical protein
MDRIWPDHWIIEDGAEIHSNPIWLTGQIATVRPFVSILDILYILFA